MRSEYVKIKKSGQNKYMRREWTRKKEENDEMNEKTFRLRNSGRKGSMKRVRNGEDEKKAQEKERKEDEN